mmetsp:Transcript_19418/g.25651  ORF Transcript_19418/g.25651 Transcript_19418/m.25651 type:complete len:106 (+) Transcript_19418:252-569(+)
MPTYTCPVSSYSVRNSVARCTDTQCLVMPVQDIFVQGKIFLCVRHHHVMVAGDGPRAAVGKRLVLVQGITESVGLGVQRSADEVHIRRTALLERMRLGDSGLEVG